MAKVLTAKELSQTLRKIGGQLFRLISEKCNFLHTWPPILIPIFYNPFISTALRPAIPSTFGGQTALITLTVETYPETWYREYHFS